MHHLWSDCTKNDLEDAITMEVRKMSPDYSLNIPLQTHRNALALDTDRECDTPQLSPTFQHLDDFTPLGALDWEYRVGVYLVRAYANGYRHFMDAGWYSWEGTEDPRPAVLRVSPIRYKADP